MEQPPINTGYTAYAIADLVPPRGRRGELADKHRGMLEAASIWFQSLGFKAPFQRTEDYDLRVESGEPYRALLRGSTAGIGSSYNVSNGRMLLTSHPDFLAADTQIWELMEASSVHELFHAIQRSESPQMSREDARRQLAKQTLAECTDDSNLDWLVEGSAAMVQVRWLEQTRGVSWGHPFKGSHRPAWVRQFDQSLPEGSLPPGQRNRGPRPEMTEVESVSWFCDYGTWYFWYAVGEMIARNDAETVAYTRYIFNAGEPWDDGGIANVDIGLRKAAEAYDAIGPYRDGLYSLYPQFVAQYLEEERFYGKVEEVQLGTPDLYETTSSLAGGPLEPLAVRAWRIRVRLPQEASAIPHTVRFTLDAADGTSRDDLHLVVDGELAGRPRDPATPYTHLERIGGGTASPNGAVEYLVRVANVARDAGRTADAEFSLRVEVQGFYGNDASATTGGIAGELPPGFVMRGPGDWSCSGGVTSRAVFDLVTPEERGREIEQAVPDMLRSMEGVADKLDIIIQKAEREDMLARESGQRLHDRVGEGRSALDAARAEPRPGMAAAADEAREAQVTTLAATFVGKHAGEMCQLTLKATLKGLAGGAQQVAHAVDKDLYPDGEVPRFEASVFPPSFFEFIRTRIPPSSGGENWNICTMTAEEQEKARRKAARSGCPPMVCSAGRLTLEHAEQGRIAGTFEFDVTTSTHGYGRCRAPVGRDKVVGHFNVASTDDGHDDNSLMGGYAEKIRGGILAKPGAPLFDGLDE